MGWPWSVNDDVRIACSIHYARRCPPTRPLHASAAILSIQSVSPIGETLIGQRQIFGGTACLNPLKIPTFWIRLPDND
jgi:hypothetical protein